ncbi:MAG TPA: hypothetical protein VK158_01225 [Acidobacteriota bacterium]|nr:hypothetical protein [Acidobacteriota bacterium]
MKTKAQVSVEFIIIFSLLLLVFTTFGYVFLQGLEETTATRGLAQTLADDIKARFISVSLSPVDTTVQLDIDKNLKGIPIQVQVFAGDNIIVIKRTDTGAQLAAASLPKIQTAPAGPIDPSRKMVISKVNDRITVTNT